MNGIVDIAISESKTVGTKMLFGLGDIQITANVDEGTKKNLAYNYSSLQR